LGGGGAREFRESREQFFGRGTAYVTIMIAAKIVFVTGEQSCVLDFGGGAVHKLGGGRSNCVFTRRLKASNVLDCLIADTACVLSRWLETKTVFKFKSAHHF